MYLYTQTAMQAMLRNESVVAALRALVFHPAEKGMTLSLDRDIASTVTGCFPEGVAMEDDVITVLWKLRANAFTLESEDVAGAQVRREQGERGNRTRFFSFLFFIFFFFIFFFFFICSTPRYSFFYPSPSISHPSLSTNFFFFFMQFRPGLAHGPRDSGKLAMGLYFPAISSMNHSCSPNCDVVFRDGTVATVVVRAPKGVDQGEEITISYIDETLSTNERRVRLRDHYGFECNCPRCYTAAPAAVQ